jgi:hypothetical protein
MTERKPPGTSWETWIDAQIRVAKEQGAFDNLPGAGKPLPSLGQEHDPDWWVKQLVQREQISALPPSLELLRKVEKELAAIDLLHDEAAVRRRVAALNVEIARVNATVMEGPPTRLGTLDVDNGRPIRRQSVFGAMLPLPGHDRPLIESTDMSAVLLDSHRTCCGAEIFGPLPLTVVAREG